jgi:NAD(P)-dependent dehydrogenase (short-subunit alcohol dehydrogenase family)
MRSYLVTGAGGGLGSSIVRLLAAGGCTVFAADSSAEALRGLRGMAGVVPVRMDVTSAAGVARARASISRKAARLDGIACCAGIFRGGALVEVPEADMLASLDVNVMGAFRVAREFVPLLPAPGGRVILVGSEASRCPMPFTGPYTVSKCGLDAFADVLRRELMFVGIRVSVVQPGAIRTALLDAAAHSMRAARRGSAFCEQLQRTLPILARERDKGMDPSRVARVVVRALHTRRPRPFIRVGNNAPRAALGLLPRGVVDLAIRCFM